MAKNNKIRFFFVLYCDKTWVNAIDQSERTRSYLYYNLYLIYELPDLAGICNKKTSSGCSFRTMNSDPSP